MGIVIFVLTPHAGFFTLFFRICTVYLRPNAQLCLDSSAWAYGHWSWYFTSLREALPYVDGPRIRMNAIQAHTEPHTLGEYRRAVRDLFRLTPALATRAVQVLQTIGQPFTALFVRRGDKLIEEASFIPMATILAAIPYTETTVFFIQTDDYGVIEEARACLPNHTIHSTVPPTKRGSYHYTTSHVPPGVVPWEYKPMHQKRDETNEMLVGLAVCLQASQCWTDDTSNVGRFLKLYSDNVHVYPTDYELDESAVAHPAWKICGKNK